MSEDIKSVLYAWLGKRKKTPVYEIEPAGSKQRLRFMCKVCLSIVIIELPSLSPHFHDASSCPWHSIDYTEILANERRYYWLYLLVHIHVHVPVS